MVSVLLCLTSLNMMEAISYGICLSLSDFTQYDGSHILWYLSFCLTSLNMKRSGPAHVAANGILSFFPTAE